MWGSGWNLLATGPSPSNTVVRIEIDRGTNRLGTVDVELFDQDKPETVRNFLLYTRSGAYSNMFLHRCVPGFVIQGGGFAVTNPLSSATFTSYLEVTNLGRLTNEFAVGPRLTNLFGTIAMAKLGSDPNSASSQWFFNLNDNSANLDNQNGGFTVFGRVLASTNSNEGTNVLQHFNTLATGAGIVNLTTFPVFSELPVSYTNSTRTPAYRELYQTRVYVLGETNAPGTNAPSISIAAPSPDARFTNQTVLITGTAEDDRGVARVLYRHQGGESQVAAGTNAWQVGLRPSPGFNTVTVEAIDWDGNHSTNASVTFFYVAQVPLLLQTNGPGTIEGLTNGQLLQVGGTYSINGKPDRGYFFDGWSGSITSSAASLTFQVATNATNVNLTAKFTRNFFPVLAGTYTGLIRETNAATVPGLENTGFLQLTLNHKGGFSGTVRHRGGSYRYTGRFDNNGSTFLQGTIGGISRTITLRLNTTNAAGIINGSVSGSSSSTVEAALERISSGLPSTNAAPAGDYPFAIAPPAVPPGPLVPGGHGFGRMSVTSGGTLKVRGTLGDGTPFTGTAKPSRAARWPFYLNMAKGRSAVQGWIAPQTNNLSMLESRLSWMRAFDIAAETYPGGFSNQVVLTGLRLAQPAPPGRYLDWVTGLSRIDGAMLTRGVTNTVRLNTNNTITVLEPNASALRLNVDARSGLVDGSFFDAWGGATNALQGVMFKPGESIRGQFRDGNQTGSLNVNVAPFLSTQVLATVTLENFLAAISDGGLIRFDSDADLTLTNAITLPYDTALDANGHSVRLGGAGLTQLFVVQTNRLFAAMGVTFADGRVAGVPGTNGAVPQAGGDACGAGVLNLGGNVGFTNCVFTNFVVVGGTAGRATGTNEVYPPGGRAWGAALCNRGGRAAVQDCLFVDNQALAGEGAAWPPTNQLAALPDSALGGAIFSDGPQLIVQGSTFRRGEARAGQPSLLPDGSATRSASAGGGAIAAVAGTLRLATNLFQTNLAVAASIGTNSVGPGFAYGGAVFVESNVTAVVVRSTYTGNRAEAGNAAGSTDAAEALGGAIYGGGSLQVTDATFEGNVAQGGSGSPAGAARGGALAALGSLSITNSTLHHNTALGGAWTGVVPVGTAGGAAWGGAIYVIRSSLNVLNSTFAYNEALSGPEANGVIPGGNLPGDRLGGAIAVVSNSTSLASLTLAFNRAGSAAVGGTNSGLAGGGAIVNQGGAIALRTSLLVSNAPANYRGSLTDVGYNFSSDASVALTPSTGVAHTNVNVLLGPLINNGGPTLTMEVGITSPARDKVPTNNLPALVDQRGIARPQPVGGFGDAGAVEAFLTNAAPIFIPPPPASATVRAGTNLTLVATAVATNPIIYRWTRDGQPILGATNSSLTLLNIQPTNAGNYALIATNSFGSATSEVATIVVDATPLIFTQPTNLIVSPTANTSFFVGASPTSGMNYYWYHDGVRVGPNAATLPITNASPPDRGSYFVVVSNAYGMATSQVATLTFNSLALQIIVHPSDLNVIEGQNTNFSVTASSFGGFIAYQWYFAGNPLPGQNTNTLQLTNVTSAHVGTYHVVVTNAYLSVTSNPAVLSLNPSAPPAFTVQPTGTVARVGSNATFRAFAIGTSPLTYLWLHNGTSLGAAGASLLLTNVQLTNAGSYAAVATNNFGAATSLVAVLTIDATPRILLEPSDLVVSPGAVTNFAVTADGPELAYAWWHQGLAVPEATNDTFAVTNAAPTDRGIYQVIITNLFGAVTSRVATLSFDSNALAIITQPTNLVAITGQVATFSVVVSGVAPFAYQWFISGRGELVNETNDTLVFPAVDLTNAGPYQVVITNDYLSVTSLIATLTVDTNAIGPASVISGPAGPHLSVRLAAGQMTIECIGVPGQTYRLLRAQAADPPPDPASPRWVEVASGRMPASGRIVWTLPLSSGSGAFYRAVSP